MADDTLSVYATGCMPPRQFAKASVERLGQYLHIDTVFYAKIFGWFSMNYVTNILRGVSTTFFLARWLPVETFGAFRYIIAVYGIAGIFSFSSFHSGIIRGIAADDTEVAWVGTRFMLRYSLVGGLLLLLAGGERWWRGETTVAMGLWISALFFPFLSAGSLYGSILTGQGKIRTASIYNTLSNILFVGMFAGTLFFFKQNLLAICITFFGGDVLLKGAMSLYQLSKLSRRGSAHKHIQLGSHLSFMGMLQSFAFQIDQIIIQRFFGYTSLANYSIATLIPDQIVDFMKSFSGIFLQRKAQHQITNKGHRSGIIRKQMYTFLFLMGAAWFGYALFAPLAIPVLFPKYRSQVFPTIIYALGILGTVTGIGLSWMQAQHQLKALWKFSVINSLLQSITTITLTITFGGVGAILAKTITRLASIPFAFPSKTKEAPPGP